MKSSLVLTLLFGVGVGAGTALQPLARELPALLQAQTQLDNDGLKQMLDGLGYETKPLSKGFLIAEQLDDWTINTQVVLSGDGNKVGLNANLGEVTDPDAVSALQWRSLLVANGNIDPSAFYFDTDRKKLYLHRSFDNRGLTASILKKEIQNFTKNVKDTGDLWKFTK